MDWEYINAIETWGSGNRMLDVLELKDGRVLVVAEYCITLYENREAFDSGARGRTIER